MPRRQFKADVADLCRRASTGSLPGVLAVNCDGLDNNDEFVVILRPRRRGQRIPVRVLCGDVDAYPNTRNYFLSIDSSQTTDADIALVTSFQDTNHRRASSRNYTVLCLVLDISEMFAVPRNSHSPRCRSEKNSPVPAISMNTDGDSHTGNDTDGHAGDRIGDSTDDDMDHDDMAGDWDDDAFDFDFNAPLGNETFGKKTWAHSQDGHTSDGEGAQQQQSADHHARLSQQSPLGDQNLGQRIGRDLRAVVRQGYRIGVLRGMTNTAEDSLLSVAVRVSELGLPRQTLLAWDLDPAVYVVLLIRMLSSYTPYEALVAYPNRMSDVSFCIGKCQRYKPSLSAAQSAFDPTSTKATEPRTGDSDTFSKIMISNSLNTFMSNNFLSLSKYRDDHDCSWADAMDAMRRQTLSTTTVPMRGGRDEPDNSSPPAGGNAEPAIVERSFPLLAMQFAMDQVVNCTRYCQACHGRMDEATASIKPTVCSDALCLFQYIQMGMGRSTEHEALAQPAVVDLLVSFCYAALQSALIRARLLSKASFATAIRTYPESIGLRVMDPDRPCPNKGIYRCQNGGRPYILLRDRCLLSHFQVGDWVAIRPSDGIEAQIPPPPLPKTYADESDLRHAVVTEVDAENATLYLSHGTFPYADTEIQHACVCRYDTSFEDVPAQSKAKVLRLILETLPPIAWIRTHLEHHAFTSLRAVPGVSSSAARLLEWILATNRSCILEIQCPELDFRNQGTQSSPNRWAQFSFLHGSPDADARFHEARQTAAENTVHPTILGWHGSAIHNWHSIVRTGLDYQVTANGRAYGNGVYFSPAFNKSHQYARASEGVQWANSQFDLQAAVSLNEIVNAPSKFRSVRPHYVVPQSDWHQCRVLLVGSRKPQIALPHIINNGASATDIAAAFAAATPSMPTPVAASGWLQQDEQYTACGPAGEPLRIPLDLLTAATNGQPDGGQDDNSDLKDADAKDTTARAEMDVEDLAFCVPGDGDTATGGAAQSSTPESQSESASPVGSTATTNPSPVPSSSSAASANRSLQRAQRRAKRALRKRARKGKDAK